MIDRFFLDDSLAQGEKIDLPEPEFRHLKVLRIGVGEEIELVNGRGSLATARVERMDKQSAHLKILESKEEPRPTPSISLGLALIRPNRLEWVIEKATELGADTIYLYSADLSEKEGLSPNQKERLQHLAISALKQCGRLYLPNIELLPSIDDALSGDHRILFGDTHPSAPWLSSLPLQSGSLLFITGPEKGFSEREHQLLHEKGKGVKLSRNILRAETAPIAALSILSCR